MSSAAIKLIDDAKAFVERGWTQRHNACDANNNHVTVDSPYACAWCLNGAIFAASPFAQQTYWNDCSNRSEVFNALGRAVRSINGGDKYNGFISYNDAPGRTKEEILSLLDAARVICLIS